MKDFLCTFFTSDNLVLLLISILIIIDFIVLIRLKARNNKHTNMLLVSFISMFTCFFVFVLVLYMFFPYIKLNYIDKGLSIKKIELKNYDEASNTFNIKINLYKTTKDFEIYCSLSKTEEVTEKNEWIKSKNFVCLFDNVDTTYKYVFIKNGDKIAKKKISNETNSKNLEIETLNSIIYLVPSETYNINASVISFGKISNKIKYQTQNENIVVVDSSGLLTGKNVGSTTILLSTLGLKKEISVVVSDLITLPYVKEKRNFIPCNRYSEEEAQLLDNMLFYKVRNAGKGTRAGVVASARFLALEFPYAVPYFLENGRLTSKRNYADGEGRFYHEGLYLSTSKFSILEKSRTGPAIWGCKLYEYDSEILRPNGLDCSGFVSWAVINGGFDIGDYGSSGWNEFDGVIDLTWFGEKAYINRELLNSGRIKAGDFASVAGHIGMVIGVDRVNEKIYISDELVYRQGLRVLELTYDKILEHDSFTHIILLDSYYKSDGNYTDMW